MPQARDVEHHRRGAEQRGKHERDHDGHDPALVVQSREAETCQHARAVHWPSNLASALEVMDMSAPSPTNPGSGVM